jgi:type IV fimbrial biogenesis protein FimT
MYCPKPFHGMTLVDLMASLAAVALTLTLGIPSFRDIQSNVHRIQVLHALKASFSLARDEALRRGAPVTVCHSADGMACSSDSHLDWSKGWIVATSKQGAPQLLQSSQLPGHSFALRADANIGHAVTFASNGIPRASGRFVYDDGQETCQLRLIPLGRIEPDQSNPACL